MIDEARVPAVELHALGKTYPNGTQALQRLHLRVDEGEFLTLIGPSGCGKSTLLQLIAGLLEPSVGTLRLWGKAPRQIETSGHRLSFVFQTPTLMPWADVQTNVRLPLELAGVNAREAASRVHEALALVGLERCAGQRPRELSLGMRMRVSIARALVTRPTLLLMDEPFAALDEITRDKLDAELLALWRRQGLTVVFVTHSIHEAVYLSTRGLVMAAHPGRLLDELRIGEPYPREPGFRVGTVFACHAQRLQRSLLRASGMALDEASA